MLDRPVGDWGRVVVIRGPSGAGRTAILQQIYEWIARRQTAPRYWPPTLTDPRRHPEGVEPRDVIYPDVFQASQGTVLPWVWWGLSGRNGCAVHAGRQQIHDHGGPLETVIAAVDEATRQRIGVAVDAGVILAGLLPGGGAAAQTIKSVIGAADNLTGALDLPARAKAAFQSRQNRFDAALRMNAGRRFTGTHVSLEDVKADGRLVASIASVVPLVVVVDDADGLDEISLAVLESLIRSSYGKRVLLVLAVNTDHHPTHPGTAYTLEENSAADHNPELHWMLSALDSQHLVTTIDLPPFTTSELTSLAWARFAAHGITWVSDPTRDEGLGQVLTVAAGRPGRLVTMLDHRAVREAILTGTTLPDLKSLTVRTATAEAFNALPEPQRVALAGMAIGGPRTPSAWLPPETLEAAAVSRWVRPPSPDHPDGDAVFVSPSLYETARAAVARLLTPDEIAAHRTRLLTHLLPLTHADNTTEIPLDTVLTILDALIDRPAGHHETPPALVAAWLRLRTAAGLDTTSEHVLNDIAHTAVGELLTATADALYTLGATQRPVDLFTTELARLEAKYGTRHPNTWSTLHNLAAATIQAAYRMPTAAQRAPLYQQAITLYTELIGLYEPSHRHTPTPRLPKTRTELAGIWDRLGDARHAIPPAQNAVTEYQRTPTRGPEHPDTLATRANLARWRGRAGDAAGAVAAFAELLPIRVRVLGPEHPDTLATRHNLASWRGEAGPE